MVTMVMMMMEMGWGIKWLNLILWILSGKGQCMGEKPRDKEPSPAKDPSQQSQQADNVSDQGPIDVEVVPKRE